MRGVFAHAHLRAFCVWGPGLFINDLSPRTARARPLSRTAAAAAVVMAVEVSIIVSLVARATISALAVMMVRVRDSVGISAVGGSTSWPGTRGMASGRRMVIAALRRVSPAGGVRIAVRVGGHVGGCRQGRQSFEFQCAWVVSECLDRPCPLVFLAGASLLDLA